MLVLVGEDGYDEADDGSAVRESTDDVCPAQDLPIGSLVGVVGPDLPPDLLGERAEVEDVGAGVLEVVSDNEQLADDGVANVVELGVHHLGVGLGLDRVEQGPGQWPRGLRGDRHQVRRVVPAADPHCQLRRVREGVLAGTSKEWATLGSYPLI